MAAVIQGHRNPFGKPLPEYSVAELDFVLEMAARDEPERWQFVRADKPADNAQPQTMAQWHNVMAGRLAVAWMVRTGVTDATARIRNWRQRQGQGQMRPGLTQGGKPVAANA